MTTATLARPNSARAILRQWAPCVAMLMLSMLSYVDRSTLAILSPTLLHDLHMTATQYNTAVGVFSICYMISNIAWGYWIDHHGLFWTIVIAVVIWSIASGGHAFILGFGSMCFMRGLLGFGEGATFPAGLSTVTETLPPPRRSFGLGLAYSGASLGAALAAILVTPVAAHYGWRAAFLITGFLGIFWIALWLALRGLGLYHPHPPEHPHHHAHAARVKRSLRSRINPALLGSVAVYAFGGAPLAFGLYDAPLYVSRVLHASQASIGHFFWIPPAGWEAGYLFWGWISDRRHARGRTQPGYLFSAFSLVGFSLVFLPMLSVGTWAVPMAMALFFLQMFVGGGFVVFSLADGVNVQMRHNAAFLAGVCGSCWALLTAFLMPVIGKLFDHGAYTTSLWLVAMLPPIGTVLWKTLSSIPASNNKEIPADSLN